MFVWIYPLAPSRQQNLKKGTSLNEQLNIMIRQGRLRGPGRSGPLILGFKFPVGLLAAVFFCASKTRMGSPRLRNRFLLEAA